MYNQWSISMELYTYNLVRVCICVLRRAC